MNRRQFLHTGAAAALGVAVFGACTSDRSAKPPAGQPPTTPPLAAPSGTAPTDLTLARTTASLEATLIDAYTRLRASKLVTSAPLLALADVFVQHHTQHLAGLNGILTTTEGEAAITAPNAAVGKQVVEPAMTAAATQDDLLHLFFTLEDAIAQTYVYAGGAATQPGLRSTMMSIGGIEARHRVLLGLEFEQVRLDDIFPGPFARNENPLPPDALLS